MKRFNHILLMAAALCVSCGPKVPHGVVLDTRCRITPVKYQGETSLCWAYAMLAAVETEMFLRGDSVNLPIAPTMRALAAEHRDSVKQRGMGQTLLNLASRHHIYEEVCRPDDYVALCGDPGKPFGQWVKLDSPDNWEGNHQFNLPPDTLLALVERAAASRRGICWEGDISERGFSYMKGIADVVPLMGRTTDDHCMAVVGLAHDSKGRRYFVMKNSWGTTNPHGGLMLMSFDYFKAKTLVVILPRDIVAEWYELFEKVAYSTLMSSTVKTRAA